MTVGQNIRALRKKRGLTQGALGELCGLSGVAVCAYEKGRTLPKRALIEKFAEALGVAPAEITGEAVLRPHQSGEVLREGILGALKLLYGSVEGHELSDGSGGRARCYCVGLDGFVLREEDVEAIARSAKATVLAQAEWMRKRLSVLQEKLG